MNFIYESFRTICLTSASISFSSFFLLIVGESDAIEENSKPKQENLDDYYLDEEPTERVETPAPAPTPTPITTTTTKIKTTTPSKPNESGKNPMILEEDVPDLPEGFDLRDIASLLG